MAANAPFMRAWNEHPRAGPAGLIMLYEGPISVFSALLLNAEASQPEQGKYVLGGRSQSQELEILENGRVASDLPTDLWGQYGHSTWCYTECEAWLEAIASNSRGPVREAVDGADLLAYTTSGHLALCPVERAVQAISQH